VSIERSIRSVHREPCRPQGNSHFPEVWHSLVIRIQADGDGVNEPEANTKEASGQASGGSAGVLRAWHAWREASRTWETLEVPGAPGKPHPTTRRGAEDREGVRSAQRTWRTGEPFTWGRGGRSDAVCTGNIDRTCRTGASRPTSLQGRAKKAVRHKTHRFRNVFGLLSVVFLLGGWRWRNKRAAPGVDRIRAWEYGKHLREHVDD